MLKHTRCRAVSVLLQCTAPHTRTAVLSVCVLPQVDDKYAHMAKAQTVAAQSSGAADAAWDD